MISRRLVAAGIAAASLVALAGGAVVANETLLSEDLLDDIGHGKRILRIEVLLTAKSSGSREARV